MCERRVPEMIIAFAGTEMQHAAGAKKSLVHALVLSSAKLGENGFEALGAVYI
jgi:hypothetical protein